MRGGFGDEKLSRRSGRSAFLWPTVTRVGFEAQALSYFSHGTEGNTGLSSPKRYLGTPTPAITPGASTPDRTESAATAARSPPPVRRPIARRRRELTPGEPPAVTALFSRGALMSFFVAEVLLRKPSCRSIPPGRRYERAYSDARAVCDGRF